MKIPEWVIKLTKRVCKEYKISEPEITWRRSRRRKRGVMEIDGEKIQTFKPKKTYSSGMTHVEENRISITAGKSRKDQKLVLLHELAHLIAPKKEHHGEKFWEIAWVLYRRYKVPINYAKKREYLYRKLSRKVFLKGRRKNN